MKSPQQHTPPLDFLQATVPACARAVAQRAACTCAQAQQGMRRIPISLHRPNPVNIDAMRLTLRYTAAVPPPLLMRTPNSAYLGQSLVPFFPREQGTPPGMEAVDRVGNRWSRMRARLFSVRTISGIRIRNYL